MDILLVNVPIYWAGRLRPVYPLGLAFIATYLESLGHEVELWDLNLYSDPFGALERALRRRDWPLVGVSLRNAYTMDRPSFPELKQVVQTIKRVRPQATVVCGGAGFSHYPEQYMKLIPEIDYGVFGEGELVMRRLVEGNMNPADFVYRRNEGEVVAPTAQVAGEIVEMRPLKYDWIGLDIKRYKRIGIQTKRGCPYRCGFCIEPVLTSFKVHYFGDEWVEQTLEGLMRLGRKKFFITDAVFNAPLECAESVLPVLKRIGGDYHAFVKPMRLTESFLERMIDAGFSTITVSVESGSRRVLETYRAPIELDRALEFPRFFRKRKDVDSHFTFILGFKRSTMWEELKTLWAMWLVAWRSRFRSRVVFEPYYIPPRTIDADSSEFNPDPRKHKTRWPLVRFALFKAAALMQRITDILGSSPFMAGKQ